MNFEPHDPTKECWEIHCHSHHIDEPSPLKTYRICLECNHPFITEKELIKAHNDEIKEFRKRFIIDPFESRFLFYLRKFLHLNYKKAKSGAEIFSCPFCIHDF